MKYRIEPDPQSIYFRCVEDCNDSIMLTDASGAILYANPAWEQSYGYLKSEYMGKRPSILHSGKHQLKFYEEMWKSISNPAVGYWKGEVINKTKAGRLIPILLMITPFKRDDGTICGYVGIGTDMTSQKKLEASLKQQEILSAVREFAEGLAHELGTILGVIRGRAEMVINHAEDKEKVKSVSSNIVVQADRIERLIGYLLRFCRRSEPVDVKKVKLDGLIAELKPEAKARAPHLQISITTDFTKTSHVHVDRNRLKEILTCFMNNAIDAINEEYKKGRSLDHEISIAAVETDNEYEIMIKDTGCGIPDENLEKIFRPYFTTKEIGKAAGLGLSIASRLAQDMGGRLTVDSVVGAGTTFVLHLPKS